MGGTAPLDQEAEPRADASLDRDSRGILAPGLLAERTAFARYEPTPPLAGLVDWFWAVRWDLPAGTFHRQQILQHPAVNISVSTPDARTGRRAIEARLTGTATRLTDRELVDRGWVVALKTTVGGLGAVVETPVSGLVDRVVGVDVVPGLCGRDLVRDVIAAGDDGHRSGPCGDPPADGDPGPHDEQREPARVAVLARAMEAAVERADPARVAQAREVAAVARVAESDRGVRRVDELARRAGVTPRTLQRMFLRHAGLSPAFVLRRYRLLDAAEAVRAGGAVRWAELAGELGYADQAHLVRDFRGALGRTPAAYARSLR